MVNERSEVLNFINSIFFPLAGSILYLKEDMIVRCPRQILLKMRKKLIHKRLEEEEE